MASNQRAELLDSIASTIADYQGDIDLGIAMTPDHVERWLNQFHDDEQPVILGEMAAILHRYYFPRERIKDILREFLDKAILKGQSPVSVLPHTQFLRIQTRGSSQEQLLEMVDEILQERFSISITSCGTKSPNTYIYIDDAIYTGNRLRYDLTAGRDESPAWITNTAPQGSTLIVFEPVIHTEGWNYVTRYVRKAADTKGITLQLCPAVLKINNVRNPRSTAECLWPEQEYVDTSVEAYRQGLQHRLAGRLSDRDLTYRPVGVPTTERLFSSVDARRVVERAFCRVGVQLAQAGQQRAESIRPLGYEVLYSLGFGTMFTTYRNIANNCPLALWWGNPHMPKDHPLGLWYPLFPRRTNVSSDDMA